MLRIITLKSSYFYSLIIFTNVMKPRFNIFIEQQKMSEKKIKNIFKDGWNKIFGKEEDMTKLRTKSLIRATKGIQNVGTPHDWEDYEKYKKELDEDTTD